MLSVTASGLAPVAVGLIFAGSYAVVTAARVDLLEDALEILPRLFTEDGVTHEGRQVSVHDLTLRPRPVQSPLQSTCKVMSL